ncbi:MAG: FCD domain-containing protein [Proteobacteria bacterium]|nr:MAG: FCD domain-containing protein [Pseudomonadota bacterium]QKK11665.1 MAG: FCD domain-containing protein [Pseudomonadota bacterium]
MQLQPIKPSRVSDTIADQIMALIRKGVVRPGEKLPAERELMSQLKVSRASVREALLKLEAKGLIYSRQGGGTFVSQVLTPNITDPLAHLIHDNPEALSDVLECRHGLEVLAASHAAVRATPTVREVIRERFSDLEAAYQRRDLTQEAKADTEFHMAIAEASNNVALIHLTRSLFNLLGDQIIHNWERIYQQQESRNAIHSQHKAILDAILARDAERARAAAQTHLAYVARCLREGEFGVVAAPSVNA